MTRMPSKNCAHDCRGCSRRESDESAGGRADKTVGTETGDEEGQWRGGEGEGDDVVLGCRMSGEGVKGGGWVECCIVCMGNEYASVGDDSDTDTMRGEALVRLARGERGGTIAAAADDNF